VLGGLLGADRQARCHGRAVAGPVPDRPTNHLSNPSQGRRAWEGHSSVFEEDIESVLLTDQQIQDKVRDLAAQISKDYQGRDVLLVEDIIDSGLTLNYLLKNLRSRRPATLEVCALLYKPEQLKADIEVKYVGFDIPSVFVVGYGLDYAEKYRNLPFISPLKPEVYRGR
jgi:hypoxanthine-guanine phosphoribosyltransferase